VVRLDLMNRLDLIRERWRTARQQSDLVFWQVVLGRALYYAVFLPLSYVVAPLLRTANVRVCVLVLSQHIGHLALEPDCYLKEVMVGLRAPARRTFLVCRRERVANAEILRYWRRYFSVVLASPVTHDAFSALARRPGVGVDALGYVATLGETAKYPEIYRRYSGRPPLLTLSDADQARGRAALARLGIPDDAWFVCVHCREGGFYDDDAHSYRNASIASFAEAMATITAAGGWCVRMGDPSTTPMAPIPNVVDYAHHAERSPWLDLFLVARSRFFLGTNSGLLGVAVAFGVPAGLTNQTPMCVVLTVGDIAIPKLMWDDEKGRLLTFAEVLALELTGERAPDYQALYTQARLRPLENDPQDVAEVAREMLQRTAGEFEVTPQDEALQRAFKDLLVPGHYSYGAASRIGRDFLRRNRDLVEVAGGEQHGAAHADHRRAPRQRPSRLSPDA
jgi:putative glycosyltransferase (TIGR04372 family)